MGSSGSNVHCRITGTRDEHGILFVSCLVVPPCHLALLVPARPRCSGHSCPSWPRFGRPRTWLIGFGRDISPTGTVGAATQPTPTGGSGIPARWCDSRISLRTSRGTHGPSTPTRMRRIRLPRPAALEERHRGAEMRLVARVCRRRAAVGLGCELRPAASPADVQAAAGPGLGSELRAGRSSRPAERVRLVTKAWRAAAKPRRSSKMSRLHLGELLARGRPPAAGAARRRPGRRACAPAGSRGRRGSRASSRTPAPPPRTPPAGRPAPRRPARSAPPPAAPTGTHRPVSDSARCAPDPAGEHVGPVLRAVQPHRPVVRVEHHAVAGSTRSAPSASITPPAPALPPTEATTSWPVQVMISRQTSSIALDVAPGLERPGWARPR